MVTSLVIFIVKFPVILIVMSPVKTSSLATGNSISTRAFEGPAQHAIEEVAHEGEVDRRHRQEAHGEEQHLFLCFPDDYYFLNVVRSSPPRGGAGVPILPTLPTLLGGGGKSH